MKRLVTVLTVMMISGISLANTNPSGNQTYSKVTTIESPAKTATKNAPALVKSPRIPKPKIFRSNPYRVAYYAANANDSDDIVIDDEDKITGYRKRDLQKVRATPTVDDPEGDITEDIRWKLFLARQVALMRYREIHG